jgi:hypothetical protein
MKSPTYYLIRLTALVVVLWLTSPFIHAQSISGNVNSSASNSHLAYGNVDIYKGSTLVATVLTDREGNFNVKLDTGTYRCVIQYAGHEKVEKTIKVTKDEKADFALKADASSKYKAVSTTTLSETGASSGTRAYDAYTKEKKVVPARSTSPTYGGAGSGYVDYSVATEYSSGSATSIADLPVYKGKSGMLTAGEINDFSKWTLWKDLVKKDLNTHSKFWQIAIKGRYTVQLTSQNGLPLSDAEVKLIGKEKVVYQSKTDNTGKAELWVGLDIDSVGLNDKYQIEVMYQGKKETIRNAKPFEQGINKVKMNVVCQQNNVVDIAFVVDATGSMGDEINFLKAELNEVIFQSKEISATLNFRFASVFYRDHGDEYLTRTMNFSRVLSESISFINDQRAGGGGDYEEAVEVALDSAVNQLTWSDEARARILFLILDAPPHNTPETRAKLKKVYMQAAKKGIRIVPLVASGINKNAEYLLRTAALATNGTYVFLTDHSGIGGKHITPTTDKFDVESLNAVLVRILKSYTYMPECNQDIPELQLTYPDSEVIYPNQEQPKDTLKNPKDSVKVITPVISWKYFPNPTRDFVTIITDRDVEEMYLTDLGGKALMVIHNLFKDSPKQIDLSDFPTGIYLIRYEVDKHWVTGKVVVTH